MMLPYNATSKPKPNLEGIGGAHYTYNFPHHKYILNVVSKKHIGINWGLNIFMELCRSNF